jgi:N-acetylmuramoyl-L-alanine amidase
MNILIDPGHGGSDPGAVANGLRECDINMAVATLLAEALTTQHYVWKTRNADTFVSLRARTDFEHRISPDLTISLHCNAAANTSARGFEVWTSIGETASDRAAYHVINTIQDAFPLRKLRYDITPGEQRWDVDREKNFWMCHKTKGPAILIEMGFITNPDEAAWLGDPNTHLQMATAIAAGVGRLLQERRDKA